MYAPERKQVFFREVKIEYRALSLDGGAPGKDCRDVGLVGSLVVGKPGVAVDAINGLLRRRDIVGRKARQLAIQGVDQLQHRQLDQGFVLFFAGLEPLSAIVALETAQKRERVSGEAGEGGFRLCHFLPLMTGMNAESRNFWRPVYH